MKNLLFVFLVTMASCSTTKPISNGINDEYSQGRDFRSDNLIIMRNGEILKPEKIKYPNHGGLNYDDYFILADGKKIYYKEMNAWQSNNAYAAMVWNPRAKDDYPVFRIRSGKINLYMCATGGGPNADTYYKFLFDKGDFKIVRANYEAFSAAIADKPDALALLNNLFPKHVIGDDRLGQVMYEGYTRDKLCRVVAVYNK